MGVNRDARRDSRTSKNVIQTGKMTVPQVVTEPRMAPGIQVRAVLLEDCRRSGYRGCRRSGRQICRDHHAF